jgi:aminopeptidase N
VDWEVDYFDKTLPMSTYLVAFVISNFKSIKGQSANGVEVEVAGRPDAIDAGYGQYALEEAIKLINYFADYFNVSYPMPKSSTMLFLFSIYYYNKNEIYNIKYI